MKIKSMVGEWILVEPVFEVVSEKLMVNPRVPDRGVVVQTGIGRLVDVDYCPDLGVVPGNVVVFKPGTGQGVELDGSVYIAMRVSELLAIL